MQKRRTQSNQTFAEESFAYLSFQLGFLVLPLQLLTLPLFPSPPALRWMVSCSLSLSLPLIQAEPWTQAAAVCESVCESVCARSGERRLPNPLLKLYLSHKHTIPLTGSPHQGLRTHPLGVHFYPHDQ